MSAFKTLRLGISAAFQAIWHDLWTALAVNALWLFFNLTIIAGPPASMALNWFCAQTARGENVDHIDFWRAFKGSWRQGWAWGLVNLVVMSILAADYYLTYRAGNTALRSFLLSLYLALAIIWLSLQFYGIPFLVRMETFSLRAAWHNAAVFILKNPLLHLILTLSLLVLLPLGAIAFGLTFFFGPEFAGVLVHTILDKRLTQN